MLLQSLLRPVLTPIMRGIFDPALCVNATGSAWSPADLTSLVAWYDPSDLTTLFQDSAGTTPVTAAGQPVGLILDKSGNGRHASQATSTARPLLEDDGGKMCLKFDGVDDFLSTSAIDLTGTNKVTQFLGLQNAAITGAMVYSDFGLGATGSFVSLSGIGAYGDIGIFKQGTGTNGSQQTAVKPAGTTGVLSFSLDLAGATPDLQNPLFNWDGAPAGIGTNTDIGAGTFGNRALYIGAFAGAFYFLNGNIYSLIIGGALYDAATVLAAETWVADKTG
jgi:hypothetical protein